MCNRGIDTAPWWWAALLAFGVTVSATASAATHDRPYLRFVGEYVGKAVSDADDELSKRDLRIVIKPLKNKKGFSVHWVSVSHKPDGRIKRKTYTIDFLRSYRSSVYRSAMRKDLFGHDVPLDPLKGDPYAWATIRGDTLCVFELHILDSGGYEIQTYRRTLIRGGMRLVYSRLRNGVMLRDVKGTLERVK